MPQADFYLKRGDTASSMYATLTDSAGAAVDIQGAIVYFRMKPIASSGTATFNRQATVLQVSNGQDGSKGKVRVDWQDGDTDTGGLYIGEWLVNYAGGSDQHFPNDGYVLVQINEVVL